MNVNVIAILVTSKCLSSHLYMHDLIFKHNNKLNDI